MSKEGAIDTAIGQLRVANGIDAEYAALEALWNEGVNQGRLDVDHKLDSTAKHMQLNTEALQTAAHKLKVCGAERDALLEEYTKTSWGKALQGMMQVGFHHPARHAEIEFARKFGAKPCKKCTDKLLPWDMLTPEVRAAKTKAVFAAVMKARAIKAVEKPGEPLMTTTTHALAGKAAPQPITPDPVLAEPEEPKSDDVPG